MIGIVLSPYCTVTALLKTNVCTEPAMLSPINVLVIFKMVK